MGGGRQIILVELILKWLAYDQKRDVKIFDGMD